MSVAAVLLAPAAALAGVVLLAMDPDRYRIRRFFYDSAARRSGELRDDDEPRNVDVLTFSSVRAWWLCEREDPTAVPVALMLDAGSEEFVVLGTGWPEHWTNRRALFARWSVYRSRPDGRVLGVRAWGRCPIRRQLVAADPIGVGDRALVHTRSSLPPPLSRLISASGPYRR